jgi:hypothetical protein
LDQSQLNYTSGLSARNLPGYSIFQSFTCGITGTLVEIDMGVFNTINGVGTLKIYSGSDTTGSLLYTSPVSINCASGNCFTNFVTSVPVVAGQVYTFLFIPGLGIPDPYGVQVESPGTYTNGQAGYIDPSGVYPSGDDLVFKTFVTQTVGVFNLESNNFAIEVFPNPFTNKINLTNTKGKEHFTLFNYFGQIVWSGNDIEQKDFSELTCGLYFLKVDNRTIKLMKQL